MHTVQKWDTLLINANLATMVESNQPFAVIEGAALAISGNDIAWLGPMGELPDEPTACASTVTSCNGQWVTPGLIDCHTHLVFAGNRANEFARRLDGETYQEIIRSGGGIHATVSATREASESELVDLGDARLRQMAAGGVTTAEIKSGYGLTLDEELKLLNAIGRLDERSPVSIAATFLGAHAMPQEYAEDREGYLDLLCDTMLPAVKEQGIATAVDAFLEPIAFSSTEVERVFGCAKDLGLDITLHADQLSDSGGAALAARFGARSADHLEYSNEEGLAAMASEGTVAVLLPGAHYALGGGTAPQIEAMREHGLTMAVASDCNPGSAPLLSPRMAMNLACMQFGLTPEEALRGMTINAAKALRREQRIGTLEVGKKADLALWRINDPAELSYWIGGRLCSAVYNAGTRNPQ